MAGNFTYQDFEKADDIQAFIMSAISAHKASDEYAIAKVADLYDHQQNKTVMEYAQMLFTAQGVKVEDFTASNNRIASNFFNRLNTQRVSFSLGNGLSFVQPDEEQGVEDTTKEALGHDIDHVIFEGAYYACIHGVSFPFWNYDHVHIFKLTEFVPLYDENDGTLRAGIRFWQLSESKPLNVTFYREDGFSQWRQIDGKMKAVDANGAESATEVLQAYKTTTAYLPADDSVTVVGEENYGALPIVPMWTSRLKQSTLVGMQSAIDAYDLIRSGFANDLQDCSMIYWIVRNAGGMTDAELSEFRDKLKFMHIANVDAADGAGVEPYTQEIPTEARRAFLEEIRNGIYEDFGALDVHTVSAGATNDHIDAAYQPMEENAADFEYWVTKCVKQLLKFSAIDDDPIFNRLRISNQKEQVEMVVQEAQWLDTATVLRKLPNIRPDEVAAILGAMDAEDMDRFGVAQPSEETGAFGD